MPKDGRKSQKIGNIVKVLFFNCNYIRLFQGHNYTSFHMKLMTVERIHPKAPVMLIFIAIFTCLPSCINLSNIHSTYFEVFFGVWSYQIFIGPRHFWEVEVTSYESTMSSKRVKTEGVRLRREVGGIAKVCHPARSRPIQWSVFWCLILSNIHRTSSFLGSRSDELRKYDGQQKS